MELCRIGDSPIYAVEVAEQSPATIASMTASYRAQYPSFQIIDSASITYNCFGYALSKSVGGPACLIGDLCSPETLYLLFSSAVSKGSASDHNIIVYGTFAHVAVKDYDNPGYYISKDGAGGALIRHTLMDYLIVRFPSLNYTDVTYYNRTGLPCSITGEITGADIYGPYMLKKYAVTIQGNGNNSTIIHSNADATIKAYNKITILPGFHAEPGCSAHFSVGYDLFSSMDCESVTTSGRSQIEEDFIDAEASAIVNSRPRLSQNSPNPTNGQTVIGYYLPESTHSAWLCFMDINGVTVKSEAITNTGEGELIIATDMLLPGVYFYSLMIDSQVIDTKRMVVK